jgi:hypothetical protein
MKMRNFISTILLAVYSIVLGHNFVPHHHHSEDSENPGFYCQLEEVQHEKNCCDSSLADHGHDSQQHHPCNFNEKIVLTKSGNFSILYLPGLSTEFDFSIQEKKIFYTDFSVISVTDPNLRHILLRGPPQFS